MAGASIEVQFLARDEGAAEIIRALQSVPQYTPERAELEAHLYLVLARCSWREADRLRSAQRRTANRGKR